MRKYLGLNPVALYHGILRWLGRAPRHTQGDAQYWRNVAHVMHVELVKERERAVTLAREIEELKAENARLSDRAEEEDA